MSTLYPTVWRVIGEVTGCTAVMASGAVKLVSAIWEVQFISRLYGHFPMLVLHFLYVFCFRLGGGQLLQRVFERTSVVFVTDNFYCLNLFAHRYLYNNSDCPFKDFGYRLSKVKEIRCSRVSLVTFTNVVSPVLFLPTNVVTAVSAFTIFLRPFASRVNCLFLFQTRISIKLETRISCRVSARECNICGAYRCLDQVFRVTR